MAKFIAPVLFYSEPKLELKFPHKNGKWIMFFDKKDDEIISEIDQVWIECCYLYSKEKLDGVNSLRILKDSNIHCENKGAILFYCGTITNVAEHGKNLIKVLNYNTTLFYKNLN